jgi:hypothetical protein
MGHPPDVVWGYTPRVLKGFLYFAGQRKKQEMANDISVGAMASRGGKEELKKTLKDLQK